MREIAHKGRPRNGGRPRTSIDRPAVTIDRPRSSGPLGAARRKGAPTAPQVGHRRQSYRTPTPAARAEFSGGGSSAVSRSLGEKAAPTPPRRAPARPRLDTKPDALPLSRAVARPVATAFRAHGAVAQLGERRVRNAKVRGSIPLGSTIKFNVLTKSRRSVAFFSKRIASTAVVSALIGPALRAEADAVARLCTFPKKTTQAQLEQRSGKGRFGADAPAEPVVSTTFRGWMAGRGSGGVLAHVGRQRDAGGLEDAADLAGDWGAGGDALAVLLDGRPIPCRTSLTLTIPCRSCR
jgi:hypothetical protein